VAVLLLIVAGIAGGGFLYLRANPSLVDRMPPFIQNLIRPALRAADGTPGAEPGPAEVEAAAPSSPGAWTAVFDGKTLDGWRRQGVRSWSVSDGCVVSTPPGEGSLETVSRYGDFQMRAKVACAPGTKAWLVVRRGSGRKPGARVVLPDRGEDSFYQVNVAAAGGKLTAVAGLRSLAIEGDPAAAMADEGPVAFEVAEGAMRLQDVQVRASAR
jgi:hypothetical protein